MRLCKDFVVCLASISHDGSKRTFFLLWNFKISVTAFKLMNLKRTLRFMSLLILKALCNGFIRSSSISNATWKVESLLTSSRHFGASLWFIHSSLLFPGWVVGFVVGVVVAGGHFSRRTSDNDTGPWNGIQITEKQIIIFKLRYSKNNNCNSNLEAKCRRLEHYYCLMTTLNGLIPGVSVVRIVCSSGWG